MLPTMIVASAMLAASILSCAHFIKKRTRMRRSMRLRMRAHGPACRPCGRACALAARCAPRPSAPTRSPWRRCPRLRRLHRVVRAGKEGTAPRGEQARDGGGRPERGCLGLMGGRERALLLVQTFKGGSGPDSCKVRNSPGFLKSPRPYRKPKLTKLRRNAQIPKNKG